MKITKAETLHLAVPFVGSYVLAMGATKSDTIIVRIHTDEGIVGLGEGIPVTPAFGGETCEDIALVIEMYLGPAIVGENPLNLERIQERMDGTVVGRPHAKAAIISALYDIAGKYLKTPVYNLLGGCYRDRIPVDGNIGIGTAEEMAKQAVGYIERYGVDTIKMKIGSANYQKDLENVKAMREAVGPDIHLIVDGNQGYRRTTALKILRKMEKYELQLIEQPIPKFDLEGMASLVHALDTPIMADESVFAVEDVMKVIRMHAADVVNIKLMKCGGIYNAKKLVAACELASLDNFGGAMSESSIGASAAAHFHASVKNVKYATEINCGLAGFFRNDDIVKKPLTVEKGFLEVPKDPGLGMELDEEKVKKYLVRH